MGLLFDGHFATWDHTFVKYVTDKHEYFDSKKDTQDQMHKGLMVIAITKYNNLFRKKNRERNLWSTRGLLPFVLRL